MPSETFRVGGKYTGILRKPWTMLRSPHRPWLEPPHLHQTERLSTVQQKDLVISLGDLRLTNGPNFSAGMLMAGLDWLNKGTMVSPEWPPTTGMTIFEGSFSPAKSWMKVSARTTSSVVTPKRRFGSKTPACFMTSAAIGTVELTGLEMTRISAFGQFSATPVIRSRTMPALMLKRSSRVIPGFPECKSVIRSSPSSRWLAHGEHRRESQPHQHQSTPLSDHHFPWDTPWLSAHAVISM